MVNSRNLVQGLTAGAMIVVLGVLTLAIPGAGYAGPPAALQPSPTSDLPTAMATPTLTTTPALPPPWPTATPGLPTPFLPTPVATATSPLASPTPAAGIGVCPQILKKVPPAAISAALANPSSVSGYLRPLNPSRPEGPMNPLRTWLSVRTYAKPFHPLYNGLEFKVGCP